MALSSLGMLASSLCSYGACALLGLRVQQVSWRMHLLRIFPVGLLMAVMFYFGNLCYLYISLAYIQMLKTGSPILTMGALALAGLEYPSVRLVASVLLIGVGTAVTSVGELHFNWLGFVFMLLSQVADAGRLVMTQVPRTPFPPLPLCPCPHLICLPPSPRLVMTFYVILFYYWFTLHRSSSPRCASTRSRGSCTSRPRARSACGPAPARSSSPTCARSMHFR